MTSKHFHDIETVLYVEVVSNYYVLAAPCKNSSSQDFTNKKGYLSAMSRTLIFGSSALEETHLALWHTPRYRTRTRSFKLHGVFTNKVEGVSIFMVDYLT